MPGHTMSVHTSYTQGVYGGDLIAFAANRSAAAPATPFDLQTDGLFPSLELACPFLDLRPRFKKSSQYKFFLLL